MRFQVASLCLAACISVAANAPASALEICKGGNREARRVTCLVDGDTGWHDGFKWRLEGIDTPEYEPQAECASPEPMLAAAATYRMLELMQDGYTIQLLGRRDRSGRELVKVALPDGRDAGGVLLAEGHATLWPHERGVWCR